MLIDVSHVIESGLVTYKGLPAPLVCDFLSREASRNVYTPGTEFHIGRIDMVANTGTYVDAPFHRFADGIDVSELPLERVANLPGLVVRVEPGERAITRAIFNGLDIRGRAVLIHTGWDVHFRTDRYFEGHPFLRPTRPHIWPKPVRHLLASTHSTSTTQGTWPGQSTPLCSVPECRWRST